MSVGALEPRAASHEPPREMCSFQLKKAPSSFLAVSGRWASRGAGRGRRARHAHPRTAGERPWLGAGERPGTPATWQRHVDGRRRVQQLLSNRSAAAASVRRRAASMRWARRRGLEATGPRPLRAGSCERGAAARQNKAPLAAFGRRRCASDIKHGERRSGITHSLQATSEPGPRGWPGCGAAAEVQCPIHPTTAARDRTRQRAADASSGRRACDQRRRRPALLRRRPLSRARTVAACWSLAVLPSPSPPPQPPRPNAPDCGEGLRDVVKFLCAQAVIDRSAAALWREERNISRRLRRSIAAARLHACWAALGLPGLLACSCPPWASWPQLINRGRL